MTEKEALQTNTTPETEVKEVELSQGGFEVSKEAKEKNKFFSKRFGSKGGGRGDKKPFNKPRPEYEQKIISLRRVTRVVAGGRRFTFSVGIVIGNRNGSVGVGLGKSGDTSLAIDKAVRDAKKNMIHPRLTKTHSIPYDIEAKYCASRVMLVPAPGKGLKVGGASRAVLDLLGAKDITGKIFSRSKNHINNAKATIEALKTIGQRAPQKRVEVAEEPKKGFIKTFKREKSSVK
jgi:small subunit ribosomal protein S5